MLKISLFGEDNAHRLIIGGLVKRVAEKHNKAVNCEWRSATGGHSQVVRKLKQFLRDLECRRGEMPDLIVVATDSNCIGYNEREKELKQAKADLQIVLALPDPHVERWLLLDSTAFKAVVGKGCDAPAYKCRRDHYKEVLIDCIKKAGIVPALGGIEFAEDIVANLNIEAVARKDASFKRFVDDLKSALLTAPQ